jgi:hypothetical protein
MMRAQIAMNEGKSKMRSLLIPVVIAVAIGSGMAVASMISLIAGESIVYAQEPVQQTPDLSSDAANNTTINGVINEGNNETATIGEPLEDPLMTNATLLRGEIGSIQSAHEQVFAWSTSGNWVIQLDGPLIGRAEPRIESFDAIIHMVRLDGNVLHKHEISNFTQYSVSHTGNAITTFNGTFSVTVREGIVHDVPGYIQFTGDLLSIWISPLAIDTHFGPTPIFGMVLPETEVGRAAGHNGPQNIE